ncbi:MAG: NifU family protein [Campylobacterota bacterium]|nr:NifU family protein [Campylobacterota bacterium]
MMPFSDEDIYEAVKNHLPTASGYVNSHGGDITLLGTKDGTAYIELIGTCHGCAMSLMTTKMVVQKELRKLIHPELNIVNIDGTPENALPTDLYKEDEPEPLESGESKEGLIDKIKNIF